jgi:hypothetical protein
MHREQKFLSRSWNAYLFGRLLDGEVKCRAKSTIHAVLDHHGSAA